MDFQSAVPSATIDVTMAGALREHVEFRYYHDPETGEPHIYEHGIAEDEVEYIVRNAGEDIAGHDNSRQAIGQTPSGRYLRVIYVPDPGDESVFVVTAYELRGKALQAHRRRRRRKRK